MLVGETEVRILSQSSDKVPAIELIQGRLLVRNPPAGSLKVGFSDRSVTVEVAPSVAASCWSGRSVESTVGPSVRLLLCSFIARRARWRCPPARNRNR